MGSGRREGWSRLNHVSYDDFRVIRTNLLEGDATTAGRLVPYTVFTDPQLGRIGLSEAEVREQGCEVLAARMPMSRVAQAIEVHEIRGMMEAVVDAETKQVPGAAVLGIEGGEIAGYAPDSPDGRGALHRAAGRHLRARPSPSRSTTCSPGSSPRAEVLTS